MSKTLPNDAVKELTLILLYLTRFRDRFAVDETMRSAWKGYDFNILNQLDESEYIDKCSYKSKSAYLYDKGIDFAKELLEKYGISDWNE